MARQTERKTIGKTTYIVTQMGALAGRSVLFRLTKLLGPVSGAIGAGGGDVEKMLLGALESWSATAKEEDFLHLCDAFITDTMIELPLTTGAMLSQKLTDHFNDHFAGHYGDMMLWMVFAIKVNFATFLGEILSGAEDALGALGLQKIPAPGSISPIT